MSWSRSSQAYATVVVYALYREPAMSALIRSLAVLLFVPAALFGLEHRPKPKNVPRVADGDSSESALQLPSFGELDSNGDGKVSTAERGAILDQYRKALRDARSGLMRAHDADKNSQIGAGEAAGFNLHLASLVKEAKELALAKFDADLNHKFSDDELEPIAKQEQRVLQSNCARVDTDGNHQINVAESLAAVADLFKSPKRLSEIADANNDGQTSQSELNAALEVLEALPGN